MSTAANHYDDLNTPAIAVVGVVSAILTFVAIVALQVLYFRYESVQTARNAPTYQSFDAANLLAQQQARLADYAWVDRQQQRVAIPIDRAMALVVRDLTMTAEAAAGARLE